MRDHFRKSARLVPASDLADTIDDCAEPSAPGPEEALCCSEIDPALTRALASLPEEFLMPLVLREFHEASYEHIAYVLDILKGTVMSWLHRARQRLQELLIEEIGNGRKPIALGMRNEDSRGICDEM